MFIARQPIFNSTMKVYGYELLYRDNEIDTFFGGASSKEATAKVLGCLFETGIHNITNGQKAFINFDYNFLLSDSMELINPDNLIIEVLEDVKVDEVLLKRLMELKDKGYKIALDDFVEDYNNYPIVPISDIIKYDIISTPLNSIEYDVKRAIGQGKTILAEKIETKEEYEKAKEMGFHLFQGYFFKKPSIIGKANDKKSIKLNYIKIISELCNNEPSYDKISGIIESDVNLAYRLLKIIKNKNSDDLFYSIKKALLYMGFIEIERWINILMLQDLSIDKPMELMRLSLIRSKFGGSLAKRSKYESKFNEITTMLLFSTLEAILDLPMKEALEGIFLSEDIKQSLVDGNGELRSMLDIVLAYEKGNWNEVKVLSLELHIQEGNMYNEYLDAIKYCNEITDKF
ncbi:MAG: hypothetical protein RBR71_10955 [Gudongella sp.]|nr:hypothetical protein [Gudongella sp.]